MRVSSASLCTGLLIGALGGVFRLLLVLADRLRDALVERAHAWPYIGRLAPLDLGLIGAALARMLVVYFCPGARR